MLFDLDFNMKEAYYAEIQTSLFRIAAQPLRYFCYAELLNKARNEEPNSAAAWQSVMASQENHRTRITQKAWSCALICKTEFLGNVATLFPFITSQFFPPRPSPTPTPCAATILSVRTILSRS